MQSERSRNTAPTIFQKLIFHEIKTITITNAMSTMCASQINWNYLTHFWLKSWRVLWEKQKNCFIKCSSFKVVFQIFFRLNYQPWFVAPIELKLKDNQDIQFHDLACSCPVKSQGYVCSAPGHFFDGHVFDGHIFDGHILDQYINKTFFWQDIFSTGHILDQ